MPHAVNLSRPRYDALLPSLRLAVKNSNNNISRSQLESSDGADSTRTPVAKGASRGNDWTPTVIGRGKRIDRLIFNSFGAMREDKLVCVSLSNGRGLVVVALVNRTSCDPGFCLLFSM